MLHPDGSGHFTPTSMLHGANVYLLEVVRAVVDAVGHDRVGIRLSPVAPANGVDAADPQPLFDYAAMQAAYRRAGGRGAWMVNNRHDPVLAAQVIESGAADLVAVGKPFARALRT